MNYEGISREVIERYEKDGNPLYWQGDMFDFITECLYGNKLPEKEAYFFANYLVYSLKPMDNSKLELTNITFHDSAWLQNKLKSWSNLKSMYEFHEYTYTRILVCSREIFVTLLNFLRFADINKDYKLTLLNINLKLSEIHNLLYSVNDTSYQPNATQEARDEEDESSRDCLFLQKFFTENTLLSSRFREHILRLDKSEKTLLCERLGAVKCQSESLYNLLVQ